MFTVEPNIVCDFRFSKRPETRSATWLIVVAILVCNLVSSANAKEKNSETRKLSNQTTTQDSSEPSASETANAEISDFSEVDQAITDTPRELSVAPVGELLHPEKAPGWIHRAPEYEPNKTHRFVVHSVPSSNQEDVEATLAGMLVPAVTNYVEEQLIHDDGAGWLLRHRLTPDFIRNNLIDGPASYSDEVTTSAGPMFQKWVQVTITPDQQQLIKNWYTHALRGRRAGSVVLTIGIAVCILSVVRFSFLRKSSGCC